MRGDERLFFTWSDQARADFENTVQDKGGQDFRYAFAKTICAGWGGNRDKPAWALAILLRELSETAHGFATGYDLLHLPAHQLIAALLASERSSVGRNEDGTVFVDGEEGRVRLSPFRIRLLKAYLEFLVTCEDCAHGEELLRTLVDPLLLGATRKASVAARGLAKILYGYRQRNFDDGHSTKVYSAVRTFLAGSGNAFTDETPFQMWCEPKTRLYITYARCYYALRDYHDVHANAVARAQSHQGVEWSERALGDERAVIGEDALSHDEAAADVEEILSEADGTAAFGALKSAQVKLFKADELKFLRPVLDTGQFGKRLPYATLRLLSFDPIQSAISTNLQTGKAKMPVAERVQCKDAQPYLAVLEDLRVLELKLADWMKVALATRCATNDDPQLSALRAEGAKLLKAQRKQSFDKPAKQLADIFAALTPALLTASAAVRELHASALRHLGDTAEDAFAADRTRFAAVLAEIYLAGAAEKETYA